MTETSEARPAPGPEASAIAVDASATAALAERLLTGTIHMLEIASVYLGDRLGFYRALDEGAAATAAELAARTGTVERYAREWLEQQAVAGFLGVDDPDAEPGGRRYELPEPHRPVLVAEEDPSYLAPLARLAVGVLRPVDALVDAYRGGAGVPYAAYGPDISEGVAALNRPMFVNDLAGWLASIPEVDERLRTAPAARVADLACGSAWSSIALARAYPEIVVDAFDVDEASIAAARANVAAAGLGARVRPEVLDVSGGRLPGRYELITIFEALHDMNDPVEALKTARESLAEGGAVLIADERVAERFTAPGDEVERFNFGWSILHCLTVGMLEEDSAGTGAVIRPDTVRRYAAEAGFAHTDVLPIEHDFWRFYRVAA